RWSVHASDGKLQKQQSRNPVPLESARVLAAEILRGVRRYYAVRYGGCVTGWSTLRAAESEVLVPAFRRKPFPAEG
uniref:Uncharacterized protein n=1 Tax=Anopheles quadriannulatus TaxID=34691 RepID=A0A182XQQ8_ANOQN